jgi:subtilisin family serine protease
VKTLVRKALATGTTGRFLVVFQPEGTRAAVRALRDKAGIATVSTADTEGYIPPQELGNRQLVLSRLGVAILSADPDQVRRVSLASEDSGFRLVVPETLKFLAVNEGGLTAPMIPPALPLGQPAFPMPFFGGGSSLDYLRGYRDAVNQLLQSLALGGFGGQAPIGYTMPTIPGMAPQIPIAMPGPGFAPVPGMVSSATADTDTATWGIQVTRVLESPYTGQGVKVAILDTGLDLNHPDFPADRIAASASFVGGDVQDRVGHGTHCTGIACGPKSPISGPRYGVACEAGICVGKVFPDDGSGTPDGIVIQGIEWALAQGCKVISMSLSAPATSPNPNPLYEDVGRTAMGEGTVLVAAAGNESKRQFNDIHPVGSPANCLSFMGVGAVDANLHVTFFSNGGLFPPAGAVDIAAPGMDIYSAASSTAIQFPPTINRLYRKLSGTSQATPFVAGIAALIAQARTDWSAAEIMDTLISMALHLSSPDRDVGAGLVQAFQGNG